MTTVAEPLAVPTTRPHVALLAAAGQALAQADPVLADLLDGELEQQCSTLAMVASSSVADPTVLAAGAAVLSNVTVEGYPGARFHSGTTYVDRVELLAEERARLAFGARWANVQPHSCTSANLSVLSGLLPPGGVLLGLGLDEGGHLTHGSSASITGRHFRAVAYGLDPTGRIDHDEVARLAREHRPGVIVAGASAYPRVIDFERFRAIADEVGAYLLADISHIAGLVIAGAHPSPIDVAHVTTTSTYKQLGGPRGGLILLGRDHDTPGPDGRTPLSDLLRRAVFPRTQGTPSTAAIAAKARALTLARGAAFRRTARLIVRDARSLAAALTGRGYVVLTGGTDNHMVTVDLRPTGLPGVTAEKALEDCGILTNRNRIPGDTRPPLVASGLRLGTNILAQRGMRPADMVHCAELIDHVLRNVVPVGDTGYRLEAHVRQAVRAAVSELCARFPLPGYGVPCRPGPRMRAAALRAALATGDVR
ncbi:serine hydroxymethyltransferase [Virgisporangium aurantiacum]|uniref:Probable serine hydroxymethyltransferase n=1 Tax=Virgisporangium aurantiacum TaxID=175570 RepID=A0A8J3Z4G3_9ACTN|nr:serine hydroxymethyltransferase [Virgisporangium aurantiacum]GIJ54785.1 serine hydroxymethyltransferase [Virgisporangium aurantiacum]